MPTFRYKARDAGGKEVTGTLVAESTTAAARHLGDQALLPIEVGELQTKGKSFITGGLRRVPVSRIGVIYEQLADLLRAGVPVLRAISVLSRQSADGRIARVLREVHDDVAGGDTVADALERHPEAFPELHVSMIRAGERGGFLEDVLTRVSQFVSRQDELRNKFVGSLIYPVILLLVGLGAVSFIMMYVVPRIRGLLDQQPNLPFATQVVFGVSDLLANHYLAILACLLVSVVGVSAFFQSAVGQRVWARLELRTPGIGPIYTMVSLCRFCRIFGTLLANGIPIIQSLRIAKDSAGNMILAEAIAEAADSVGGGESLAQPLSRSGVFPPAIIDMLAVAEESNTLEKVLIEVANTQEQRTARQIDLFVRLLEPLMLLLMAGMVLFIAVALLLPILRMSSGGLG